MPVCCRWSWGCKTCRNSRRPLKVRRGCSYHGLSFNADLDLAPFAAIDPCGYPGLAVTTARRLGITDSLETLADALLDRLAVRLSR